MTYAAVVKLVPWLRGTVTWVQRGSFSGDVRLLCVTSGVVAAVVIVGILVLLVRLI